MYVILVLSTFPFSVNRCVCLKKGDHWTIKDVYEEAVVLKIRYNADGDIMALTGDGLVTCYKGNVEGSDQQPTIKYSCL